MTYETGKLLFEIEEIDIFLFLVWKLMVRAERMAHDQF